jgi:hypothetical protein
VKYLNKRTSRKRHPGKRRKQTAKSMLIRGFLQSFFIVAILLIASVVGYQTTMKLWMVEEEQSRVVEEPEPTPVPITTPSIDEVSKNLIFCYDTETHAIRKLILEVFHCERKQMTYITIPTSTQFTMSDVLYKKLITVQPSIPQMIRLSAVTRYLDASVIYDYGVLLVEDMLGLKISYYTVMPVEVYQSIFEEQSIPDGINAKSLLTGESEQPEDGSIVAEVFTQKYLEFLDTIESAEELSTYMEEVYATLQSNLTLEEKMNYLESYGKTSMRNVSFTRLAGEVNNSGFVLDQGKSWQQLQQLGAMEIKD